MLDAAVLEGIDSSEVDAHREVIESDQQGEDNDDDVNEVRRNDKGGLKIDKNKRGNILTLLIFFRPFSLTDSEIKL